MNLNFLSGYKTLIGGMGFVATGIGLIISSITWEPFAIDGEMMGAGFGSISLGFAAWGWGHKVEKAGPK